MAETTSSNRSGPKSGAGLEATFEEWFVKKAPFQIPAEGRKWIATYAWVFELIFVIFGALAFFALMGVLGWVGSVATATGAVALVGYQLTLAWASLLILGAEVVVGAMAVPKLKNMEKAGWNLAYWVALFNVAYGVAYGLAHAGFGSILGQLIGSAIGLYVLFQVRSLFKN